jgi:hypothetical protein
MPRAAPYARYIVEALGPALALRRHGKLVRAAAAVDRAVCARLAEVLPQPIPPMRTFLSLVNVEAHADYVDACQRMFPPGEWILAGPADLHLINALPRSGDIDEIHRSAIERLGASPEPEEEPPLPPAEVRFSFAQPAVAQIPKPIRATEPAALASVTAFLWHGTGALPDGFAAEDLEAVAEQFPSDARLLTGFFLWEKKHGRPVDTEKWAAKMDFAQKDSSAVYAIAAFLAHVAPPISQAVRRLIALGFAILRVQYSHIGLAKLAVSQGIPWIFARGVAAADPSEWPQLAGAVAQLTSDRSLFEKDLSQFSPSAILAAAAEILLPPPQSAVYQYGLLPAYAQSPRALSFHRQPAIPQGTELPDAVVDRIIEFLTPLVPIPLDWLHFFAEVKLDGDRLDRVQALFAFNAQPRTELILVPTLFPVGGRFVIKSADGTMDDDIHIFFSHKPPSFTRRFIRSLSSLILPITMRRFVADVVPLLTPVFPALAYADTAIYNVKLYPEALPFTLFQIGRFTADIGRGLIPDIKSKSIESVWISEGLMTVADANLRLVMPWVTGDLVKEAVLRTLIDSAVAPDSNIAYARAVIESIVRVVSAEQAMVLFCNREFVNKPNFPCVFVIFKYFKQKMAADGRADIADYCTVFQNPELEMVEGEAKIAAFKDLSDPRNVAAMLHNTQ